MKTFLRQLLPRPFIAVYTFLILCICPSICHGQLWTWSLCTNAPNLKWYTVASSSDGKHLIAGGQNAGVYISADGGITWSNTGLPAKDWESIACSSNGMTIYAANANLTSSNSGSVFRSLDGGHTWVITSAPTYFDIWTAIATSADGSIVVGGFTPSSRIATVCISTDSGNTWNTVGPPMSFQINGLAITPDASHIIVAPYTNQTFESTDGGASWQAYPLSTSYGWSIACSSDASKQILGCINTEPGNLYTSSNGGITWISNSPPYGAWYSVAMSSNATVLAAAGATCLCTSTNFGQTWISNNLPHQTWYSVTMSGDGNRILAGSFNGPLCIGRLSPTLSTGLSGTNLTLSWSSLANNFQLYHTSDLTLSNWNAASSIITMSNGQYLTTVPQTGTPSFYRLQSQ